MKKNIALTIFQGQHEGQEDQEGILPISYKLSSWDVTGFRKAGCSNGGRHVATYSQPY